MISAQPPYEMAQKEAPFGPITIGAADSILSRLTLDQRLSLCFAVLNPDSADVALGFGGVGGNSSLNFSLFTSPLRPIRIAYWSALDTMNILPISAISSLSSEAAIENYAYELGLHLKSSGFDALIGFPLSLLKLPLNSSSSNALANDPAEATAVAKAFYKGIRGAGVHFVASAFPGDHIGLPSGAFSPEPIKSADYMPFKSLINDGLNGVLLASNTVSKIDSALGFWEDNIYSPQRYLREEMGYKGLIWGSSTFEHKSVHKEAEQAIKALQAGSDVVIIEKGIAQHLQSLKDLIKTGSIQMSSIDEKCRRIIQAQLWTVRRMSKPDNAMNRRTKLMTSTRMGYSNSLLCIKNDQNAIPLRELDTTSLVVFKIGKANLKLAELVDRYAPAMVFQMEAKDVESNFETIEASINKHDLLVLIAEADSNYIDKNHGMNESYQSVLSKLMALKRNILLWNGPDLGLISLKVDEKNEAILIGHATTEWSDDLGLQAIFGGRAINGEMRRKLKKVFIAGESFKTAQIRLAYGTPEEVGIRSEDLEKIAQIANKGIDEMAYPGCQVWFAKDSMVIYNHAFGHHTYQKEQEVKTTDLYDLASITKIAASTAALMSLSEAQKFQLDHALCDYLGDWVDTTAYSNLGLREILAHQAGLPAWVPFYNKTLSKGVPRYDVYSLAPSELYPTQVARELFIKRGYEDVMFRQILKEPLGEKKYKYSDIGYYFTQRIIERQSGSSLDKFLDSVYYKPLGLTTMGYNPLNRFHKDRITPTEFDKAYRGQLIHGYVHDPAAAMLGGVGGHAGLFSNANDLGILMQMFLNGGSYGGETFFSPAVIADYTRCQFCDNDNRRGAGFDKPLRGGGSGPSCGCTDKEAFGHQGFTGTVTWADPGENVVYVFLSNRVYPNAENKKLLELNIRTDIQKAFYEAIQKGKELANDDNS